MCGRGVGGDIRSSMIPRESFQEAKLNKSGRQNSLYETQRGDINYLLKSGHVDTSYSDDLQMSLRKCKKRECCTMTLWYKKSNVEFLVPLAAVEVSVRMMAGFSQTQATLTYTNLYKDQPVKNI